MSAEDWQLIQMKRARPPNAPPSELDAAMNAVVDTQLDRAVEVLRGCHALQRALGVRLPLTAAMRILAIETSCDETSAAIVEDGRRVLSNLVHTQIARHQPYGGVVPEIACRLHLEVLPGLLDQALREAGATWDSLDAIAVTRGPGLASSLLVASPPPRVSPSASENPFWASITSKATSAPFFSPPAIPRRWTPAPACSCWSAAATPSCCALRNPASAAYSAEPSTTPPARRSTRGPSCSGSATPAAPNSKKRREAATPAPSNSPRGGLRHRDPGAPLRLDFSFSGLKTSLLYHLRSEPVPPADSRLADIAASYQEAVVDALASQCARALEAQTTDAAQNYRSFACVGGVARNSVLRERLSALASVHGVPMLLAAPEYCTDNARHDRRRRLPVPQRNRQF
jgi:N6-L-threonylcarbamoyladenine synthase